VRPPDTGRPSLKRHKITAIKLFIFSRSARDVPYKIKKGIIETCLEMNRSGLNQGTSGNVSHRIDGGMLITPTSLPYAQMKPADIVAMNFDGTYSGRRLPSSEWRFHRDILKNRTDVNIVLHTHSVYCTTLATHELGIPSFHYMVAVAGGTDIRCSDYACFGTQELSDTALKALEGRTACLLGHHGLIVLADTFEKALWRAHEIETLAKCMFMHLRLASSAFKRSPNDAGHRTNATHELWPDT